MAMYPNASAACEAQLCFGLSLNTFSRSSQSRQYSRNPARPCAHLMELNRHLGIVSWAALIRSGTLWHVNGIQFGGNERLYPGAATLEAFFPNRSVGFLQCATFWRQAHEY